MSTISIFGTWQLTSVSDNYPRVDLLSPDIPLSAYLRGIVALLIINDAPTISSLEWDFGREFPYSQISMLTVI